MARPLPLPPEGYIEIPGFPELIRHPEVLGGKPCIRGTRISADLVLGFLAGGSSVDEIRDEYEDLTRQEIVAVIRYASALMPGNATESQLAA